MFEKDGSAIAVKIHVNVSSHPPSFRSFSALLFGHKSFTFLDFLFDLKSIDHIRTIHNTHLEFFDQVLKVLLAALLELLQSFIPDFFTLCSSDRLSQMSDGMDLDEFRLQTFPSKGV